MASPGTPFLDRPLKLTISITRACNQDCALCYSRCHEGTETPELDAEQWRRFIDYLAENGFVQIFVEGGEPLLKPGIFDMLEHAAKNLWVWLRTNATLIDEAAAQRLAKGGLGTACVDLCSADPDVHDSLTGVPGSHARTLAGIRSLNAAGIPVYVLVILTRFSAPSLQAIAELSAALGARALGILRLYPLGRAKARWSALALSLDEMMSSIARVTAPPGLRIMHSWHPNDGNCCYQNAAVSPSGDSIGCPYLREYVNYGNIRDVSFLDTWNHPLYVRLRSGDVTKSCPGCQATQRSNGGCRSTAYAFTGRWDAPDPFCATLNQGVDLRELPRWLLQNPPKPPDQAGERMA